MILDVFSVQDSLSSWLSPTFEVNSQVALRNFEHAVLNSNSLFFSHPEHYRLCRIGTFNVDSALLTPVVPPEEIVSALSIVQKSFKEGSHGI